MPKPPSDKTKITIRLFDGDIARMKMFYPISAYNRVVRTIVKLHLDQLEQKLNKKQPVELSLPAPSEEKL